MLGYVYHIVAVLSKKNTLDPSGCLKSSKICENSIRTRIKDSNEVFMNFFEWNEMNNYSTGGSFRKKEMELSSSGRLVLTTCTSVA